MWLSGKLFAALLVEKLVRHACAISPGYGRDLAGPVGTAAEEDAAKSNSNFGMAE